MDRKYYYFSGLPRSGSTVLASILSQNPLIYCSATSVLVALINNIKKVWIESNPIKSFEVEDQYRNVMMGIFDGLYKHTNKPIIFDKNRAWPNPLNISLLKKIFVEEPKIICTVRDVVDILASFIKLIRKNLDTISFIDKELIESGREINDENRCSVLMADSGHVFQSWSVVRWGFNSGYKNFLFIEYEDIIEKPVETISRIYDFLEMDYFEHDLNNIINFVQEDDSIYSLPGMHNIRGKLERELTDSENILGEKLYKKYTGGCFWRKGINK